MFTLSFSGCTDVLLTLIICFAPMRSFLEFAFLVQYVLLLSLSVCRTAANSFFLLLEALLRPVSSFYSIQTLVTEARMLGWRRTDPIEKFGRWVSFWNVRFRNIHARACALADLCHVIMQPVVGPFRAGISSVAEAITPRGGQHSVFPSSVCAQASAGSRNVTENSLVGDFAAGDVGDVSYYHPRAASDSPLRSDSATTPTKALYLRIPNGSSSCSLSSMKPVSHHWNLFAASRSRSTPENAVATFWKDASVPPKRKVSYWSRWSVERV